MPRLPFLASGLLLATTLLAVPTAPAQAADPQFCSDGRPAPCLVSILRDGGPVDPLVYSAFVDTYTPPEDAHNTGFTMLKNGSTDLVGEAGHSFTVEMNTGDIKPRIVNTWGIDGHAERSLIGGDWHVTVTLTATDMLLSCSGSGCPVTAPADSQRVEIGVHIDDASWYADGGGDPEDLNGIEMYSNINLLWYPPTITVDPAGVVTMDIAMQNSHYYPDGSTVFLGHATIRLPNRVLRDLYGIPDPATMTPGSIVSTTTSGTVTSAPTSDGWQIVLDGMTFSKQHLRLRTGTIVPTRPAGLSARRVTATRAKLFATSSPRGARVKGFSARCVGGRDVVTARSSGSPVVVTGLRAGRAYDCKVRALSKAGPSKASAVTIPKRP